MKIKTFLFCIALWVMIIDIGPALSDQPDIIRVGEFLHHRMEEWFKKAFVGETIYTPAMIEGNKALEAVSQNSASGLIKKIRIDIDVYPFLNWSRRIENRLSGTFDEKHKEGDDYAARIYVVVGRPCRLEYPGPELCMGPKFKKRGNLAQCLCRGQYRDDGLAVLGRSFIHMADGKKKYPGGFYPIIR